MQRLFATLLITVFAQATENDQRVLTIHGKRNTDGDTKHPLLKNAKADVVVFPDEGAISTRMTQHEAKSAITAF